MKKTNSFVHSRATGIGAALILLLCIVAGLSQVACGSETTQRVAAVISRDLEPYREALAGVKETLRSPEIEISLHVYRFNNGATPESNVRESISSGHWDLLLCIGSEATRFVQTLQAKAPIIFCVVSDPEGQGIITHGYAETWVAGVTADIPVAVQFEKLKEAVPGAKTIGVVYDRESSAALIEKAKKEAEALGLELLAVPVRDQREVPNAFTQLENRVDALWAIADRTVYSSISARFILTFALRTKTPFVAYSPQYAKAGALFALSCDYTDLGRQAGELAAEVLRTGELPADRIITPRKHILSVNLRVMKVIERRLPPEFLRAADIVFE